MNWHSLTKEEAIEKTFSNPGGLSREQAVSRIKQFGFNSFKRKKHFASLKIFLSQFKSFLIIILIFAGILSLITKSVIDSAVIFAILFLNAGLGFFQEYRAEKTIEKLRELMILKTKVLRENRILEIDSKEIVPGDILILRGGDKISADARILNSENLKVDESALTGESFPEEKISRELLENTPLADRLNMLYQGTEIVSGSGKAVVINTGAKTELGRISELVQKIKPEKNPFKEKLDSFAKKIGIFTLILSGLIIGLLTMSGVDFFQSFLVSVSLAVSAIPEGLPAVVSLGFAFATKRMAKKNILVRKLPASETLGRVSIICVDKTGTLTEEEIRVTSVYANGKMNPESGKDLLFKIGILCNNARIEKDKNMEEYIIGDPTEKALILSARSHFLDKKKLTEKEIKIKEFSFTSQRKMMSVVRKDEGKLISYVKGAPEKIINNSSFELIDGQIIRLNQKGRQRLAEAYKEMAEKGMRVLGFACKWIHGEISIENAESGLVFVGFQGMINPPRPEIRESIKLCKEAGIKILMITGDSKITAKTTAEEIGLNGLVLDSVSLQKISDEQLMGNIDRISVFARISPEDKLRIVNVLKKKGEIVAMTGDGVNDALALRRADIGISMGKKGTDVAKESSDIILLDDNFSSIIEGIKEGRRMHENVKKFVKFLLSANFYEVFFILLITLIWRNPELLPFLPLQILWINFVTDSFPALALSSEAIEPEIMRRKPQKDGILKDITGFLLFSGIVGLVLVSIVFWNNTNIDKARTMVVTTSIIYQMFLVFNCKSNKLVFKSSFNKYLVYTVLFSIGMHILVLYTSLGKFFNFVSLGLSDWVFMLILGVSGFILIELFKLIFMRHKE